MALDWLLSAYLPRPSAEWCKSVIFVNLALLFPWAIIYGLYKIARRKPK